MFSQECAVDTTLGGLHKMINDHIGSADSSNELVIAIDGMLWLTAAMNNPSDDSLISSQFHAQPPIPVTAAGNYFTKRCTKLQNNKFKLVVIFESLY